VLKCKLKLCVYIDLYADKDLLHLYAVNLTENKLQDTDHVARVARFAIDAVAAAANMLVDVSDPSKGTVTLRAGFDCGPAMACVVGTRAKKFVLLGERSLSTESSHTPHLFWFQRLPT
jgi:hypothetical protein